MRHGCWVALVVAVSWLASGCAETKPDCLGAAVVCGGTCADLQSDNLNCGACGTACAAGKVCSSGACAVTCAAGQVNCGGSCIEPGTDRNHCGASATCTGATAGVACAPGELCSAGRCGSGSDYQLMLGEQPVRGTVIFEGETLHVFHGGTVTELTLFDAIAHAGKDEGHGGKLVAPMPGKIVALLAPKGGAVKKGAPLLVMEAMKMEHTITAPSDGTVAEFLYGQGDQVAEGAELLKFTT